MFGEVAVVGEAGAVGVVECGWCGGWAAFLVAGAGFWRGFVFFGWWSAVDAGVVEVGVDVGFGVGAG